MSDMSNTPAPKRLFISHIHEESALAAAMKGWLEIAFVGMCSAFVSSDNDSIPPGSNWLKEIDCALKKAQVLIVLCSPAALARPWINFETGCGWAKEIPVIPVCHSGQKKAGLPPPISALQALELDDKQFVPNLMSCLTQYLEFPRTPQIDGRKMQKELLVAATSAQTRASATMQQPVDAFDNIPEKSLQMLEFLGNWDDIMTPNISDMTRHFAMSKQRVMYFLDFLIKDGLMAPFMDAEGICILTEKGRKRLFG